MPDPTPQPPMGSPRQPIDPAGTSTPPPPPPGYVPAVYVQHPSGSGGATKIITYLLLVGLLVSITLNVYLWGPVRSIARALAMTGPQEQSYNPPVELGADSDRIVVVEISGTIDAPTAEFARQAFYTLGQNPPAAVVLRVESGGGGVTASDQIWHAIQQFKAEHKDVPIIASFGNVAASGGYYISAPADRIFCERTGITGSIGVLAQVPGLGGLTEKLGVEMNMVIADQSPRKDDANNLFIEWYDEDGELTQEGRDAVAVLKNLVNDAYDTFLQVVVEGRTSVDQSITEEQLKAVANGAIYIGQEAIDAKLVDEIGYLDDAIAYAATQAGVDYDPEKVMVLREPAGFRLGVLLGQREGVDMTNVTGGELRDLAEEFSEVRLEYRMRLR